MADKQNTIPMIAVGILVVGILGIGGYMFMGNQSGDAAQTDEPVREETLTAGSEDSMEDMEPAEDMSYTDGEYTARGTYESPAGQEAVNLEVTLEDDIITAVSFNGEAENDVSIKFQSQFADGYEEFVIGKDIDTVVLDKVSGSSLTSGGFNDALEQIKQEAQG
jgi:uncharacterized protein with FMN-binding domain